jgi:hypothetical protein
VCACARDGTIECCGVDGTWRVEDVGVSTPCCVGLCTRSYDEVNREGSTLDEQLEELRQLVDHLHDYKKRLQGTAEPRSDERRPSVSMSRKDTDDVATRFIEAKRRLGVAREEYERARSSKVRRVAVSPVCGAHLHQALRCCTVCVNRYNWSRAWRRSARGLGSLWYVPFTAAVYHGNARRESLWV